MKSRICALILCLALWTAYMPASAKEMYAPDGRTITVNTNNTEAYRQSGWYDVPVREMYAADGRVIVVSQAEADAYNKVGWYYEPVKEMYAADGRSIVIYRAEADAYRQVGWYDAPVTVMHALDGRKVIVYDKDVPLWESCDWYKEPVALMTKDGVPRCVMMSELGTYRAEGWNISRHYSSLYGLGTQIEQYMKGKSGKYGVYIKNLSTGDSLIINDGQFSAASIIKLFVMAGTYNEIYSGNIQYDDTIKSYLSAMISWSDNYSSNRLVKAIGGGNYFQGFERENAFSHLTGCINTRHKSLFSGYGDYVSYGNNLVSPLDCGILLEKIYDGTLVCSEYSSEMLSLLKSQQRRNKIPHLLPKGTICANKTGENDRVQSDVGIVYSPNCDYIICVITNYSPTGIGDIRQISDMTYKFFN